VSDVFLDTVGMVAILNRADQWHAPASKALGVLEAGRKGFITTDLIFYEAGNVLARTRLRLAVDDLRTELQGQNRIHCPEEADCELAWQAFRNGRPGDAGIVDCISFAVMRRLGLTEVFTHDQHFTAAGFTILF